jgi:hypothetical protein
MLEEGGVDLEEKTVKEVRFEIQSVEMKEEVKPRTYHMKEEVKHRTYCGCCHHHYHSK